MILPQSENHLASTLTNRSLDSLEASEAISRLQDPISRPRLLEGRMKAGFRPAKRRGDAYTHSCYGSLNGVLYHQAFSISCQWLNPTIRQRHQHLKPSLKDRNLARR